MIGPIGNDSVVSMCYFLLGFVGLGAIVSTCFGEISVKKRITVFVFMAIMTMYFVWRLYGYLLSIVPIGR